MNTIYIKNFGPIGEGFNGAMPIYPVTIICGDQGAGKSTVIKLISTFAWLEKALVRGDIALNKKTETVAYFRQRLEFHRIHNYLKDNSEIHYIGIRYSFHYEKSNFSIEELDSSTAYPMPKIMYIPAERMVESKSLKLYLFSFRNNGDFHEDCVNIIMKDLVKLMDPKYIEVIGLFTPRGGISIYPYANYGRPGTKYEKMAEQRMLNHRVI